MTLAERADALPTGPGVYLFKNAAGRVLYVGKAQNLRGRVRSYLGGGDGRPRIPWLVERCADVDVIVTANVKDALLLENELIKRHKPPFNVRLRDDKQYLALRLDARETWPRVTQVRRFRKDGAAYFGPYTSSVAMRESLYNLRRIFPLRSCREAVFRDYARRGRPCIEFEMKRCLGPCCGLVTREAYEELVRGTTLFLRGRSSELAEALAARMQEAAAAERFEDAARLRNQIQAVARTVERQQMVTPQAIDRDVFALAREGGEVEVQALHVRDGRVMGMQGFGFSNVSIPDGDVMSSFLGQFYGAEEGRELPAEVLTPEAIDDDGALAALFAERSGRRVALRAPRRGRLLELLATAHANAELGLAKRLAARESVEAASSELAQALGLRRPPRHIEGYDVSTFAGTLSVASRVVFRDGQAAKQDFRRYRIREAAPDDDLACLREVLTRRLARVASEPLPDLMLVDGGKGQLAVLCAALADAGLDVDAISLAKQRDVESPSPRVRRSGGLKAERIFLPGRKDPVSLPASSKALLLVQRIRDESHRFAIEFQRQLRSKAGLVSILEELPGIGPTKRRALLRQLGSLRAVRGATPEQLAAVPGISPRDAAMLHRFFAALAPGSEVPAELPAAEAPAGADPE
jgi:excinuclease ABC subunit C